MAAPDRPKAAELAGQLYDAICEYRREGLPPEEQVEACAADLAAVELLRLFIQDDLVGIYQAAAAEEAASAPAPAATEEAADPKVRPSCDQG